MKKNKFYEWMLNIEIIIIVVVMLETEHVTHKAFTRDSKNMTWYRQ